MRICTRQQNSFNQRGANKTGYKGVYQIKGRYQASIYLDGHNKSLGYFEDPHSAALAYNLAALEHHGDFARLNLIKEAA